MKRLRRYVQYVQSISLNMWAVGWEEREDKVRHEEKKGKLLDAAIATTVLSCLSFFPQCPLIRIKEYQDRRHSTSAGRLFSIVCCVLAWPTPHWPHSFLHLASRPANEKQAELSTTQNIHFLICRTY